MRAREFITESTEREIAQIQYMQGECAVLALTIRNMNPQRYTLGFVYEFFDSSPDMYLEPDEFDELDPARQRDIQYRYQNWTLTHAYVYDALTREYIDAEGRHKQLPMIGRSLNSTRHNKFPAETQDLVNVSHHMEWDEAQEKWIVLQGWDALDKAYTPEDKQRAREYAIKYLGIDQPAQAVAEDLGTQMRATEFITEWQEADLYHATSIPGMLSMWHNDKMGVSGDVSTTRNYNYALGYLKNISTYGTGGGVIFTLDQDLLRRDIGRRRMPGTDWFKGEPPESSSDEFQRRSDMNDTDRFETLIKNGLKPFRKYVKKIQIWLPKKRKIKPTPPGENPMYRYSQKPGDDPDQHYDVSVDDELMQNNWFRNPKMKATWDAVLRDPRTEVKQEIGYQKTQHNVPVSARSQYGPDHALYDPSRDEHR
jgi:hypothetical protein